MSPATTIVLLWLGFAGSHLLLSHLPIRERVVAALGVQRFQGLYSLLSFVFFVPLVWVYFRHIHDGPLLWSVPQGFLLTWIVQNAMLVPFVLLAAGLVRPSPAAIMAGPPVPAGAFLLARHPMFTGFALFGLIHLFANSTTADVAFFAGFPIFALVGCWHQDQRKLAQKVPGYEEFVAGTPFIPFTGSETLRGLRELGWLPIAIGVGLAIVARWAHKFWLPA
jgi:uncharacterized membrane protein